MTDTTATTATAATATEGTTTDRDAGERERWSSRAAFYSAAIGSAVGFGNVWRFPSLVYEYGGGAFFVPYLLALAFVGLPVLVLEVSLGQYYETGDVDVFGGIHRRLRGVGLSSIACGYMLVTYYSMLLAWVANAFFDSFGGDNFWANEDVTAGEATKYFQDAIIGMETLPDDLRPTRLVWKNVGYSLFAWAIVYLCVAFGIKVTGRITYFTMGTPVVLLFVMLGRSVGLEGSREGIRQYLSSDWSVLLDDPGVWAKAVSQIFFSLSITFGIMTAYGSHCHRDEPAFVNSCVIAVSNSLFSFIAGLAVFAILGHLSFLEDTEIADLSIAGFGLVFGSWPVALRTLPGGEHWIRVLFFMLFVLGIDSAFSFMESFHICLRDAGIFPHAKKKHAALGLAGVTWLCSLLYATDAGLIFLDTIDYYINFVMLLVGFAECFAAGWIYNLDEQVDNLGAGIVFSYMATTFGSLFLACVLWVGIEDRDTAIKAGFIGLVAYYTTGMMLVCFLMHQRKQKYQLWSWRTMFFDLTLRNVMDLRADLAGVVGYLPVAWVILIKYFIPPVLLVLFSLGCVSKTSTGETEFGHYSGYPLQPYQLLGMLTVVFAGFLFVSSLVVPRLYNVFQKSDSPIPSKDCTLRISDGRLSFCDTAHGAEPPEQPPKVNNLSFNLNSLP